MAHIKSSKEISRAPSAVLKSGVCFSVCLVHSWPSSLGAAKRGRAAWEAGWVLLGVGLSVPVCGLSTLLLQSCISSWREFYFCFLLFFICWLSSYIWVSKIWLKTQLTIDSSIPLLCCSHFSLVSLLVFKDCYA